MTWQSDPCVTSRDEAIENLRKLLPSSSIDSIERQDIAPSKTVLKIEIHPKSNTFNYIASLNLQKLGFCFQVNHIAKLKLTRIFLNRQQSELMRRSASHFTLLQDISFNVAVDDSESTGALGHLVSSFFFVEKLRVVNALGMKDLEIMVQKLRLHNAKTAQCRRSLERLSKESRKEKKNQDLLKEMEKPFCFNSSLSSFGLYSHASKIMKEKAKVVMKGFISAIETRNKAYMRKPLYLALCGSVDNTAYVQELIKKG